MDQLNLNQIDPTHIPEDVVGEILFKMKINDILYLKRTSRNWKYVIDKLWCRLLERDYKIKVKDNCEKKYKDTFEVISNITIKMKDIKDSIKKHKSSLNVDNIFYILEKLGFYKANNEFIYMPNINNVRKFIRDYVNDTSDYDYGMIIIDEISNVIDYYLDQEIYKSYERDELIEIIKDVLPKRFIVKIEEMTGLQETEEGSDEEVEFEQIFVGIPYDLFIKAFNYQYGNFDEEFIRIAKKDKRIKDEIANEMLGLLKLK